MEHSSKINEHWKSYALFFKTTMAARKLNAEELAKKAGIEEATLKDFLDQKKVPGFEMILAITDALGLELYFEPRDKSTSLRRLFDKGSEELSKDQKEPKNKKNS